MRFLIFVCLFVRTLCDENDVKYPENPADISSINNLAYKPAVSLDPRIRKALLNVLNRLELQDTRPHPETEMVALGVPNTADQSPSNVSADNVKWEYKANDTFKEYNFYETVANEDKKVESQRQQQQPPSIDDKNEEPGALFFQIPDRQEPFDKHESLNLQETKNAVASNGNGDLSLDDVSDENAKTRAETSAASTAAAVAPLTPNSSPTAAPSSKKTAIDEKDVEVFQAPLLTAFTLEHDERGLPRRIIPLEASELRSILDNRILPETQPDVRRAREPGPVFRLPQTVATAVPVSPLLQEEKRIRFELETQFQELQERKRQIEYEKERLYAEHEKARRLKYALEQRQKEHEYLRALNQNEIAKSEFALQKSIEPTAPFGLFGPRPSVALRPLFAQPSRPQPQYVTDSVDRQLQNLFHRSGLGRQEDLNIVSKVLALNHDGEDEERSRQTSVERGTDNFVGRNQKLAQGAEKQFARFR